MKTGTNFETRKKGIHIQIGLVHAQTLHCFISYNIFRVFSYGSGFWMHFLWSTKVRYIDTQTGSHNMNNYKQCRKCQRFTKSSLPVLQTPRHCAHTSVTKATFSDKCTWPCTTLNQAPNLCFWIAMQRMWATWYKYASVRGCCSTAWLSATRRLESCSAAAEMYSCGTRRL